MKHAQTYKLLGVSPFCGAQIREVATQIELVELENNKPDVDDCVCLWMGKKIVLEIPCIWLVVVAQGVRDILDVPWSISWKTEIGVFNGV